jgi:hypothetical protein
LERDFPDPFENTAQPLAGPRTMDAGMRTGQSKCPRREGLAVQRKMVGKKGHREQRVPERIAALLVTRRYGVLSVASQFFGGLLGLAGIAMMMESAARQENLGYRDKLSSFSAVTIGDAAVSDLLRNMIAKYPIWRDNIVI